MYIRRKVYSVLTDDYGQERLFSTNDIVLDDYEDYYVDDRLFADRERDWADAAIGTGAGLGAAGAGVGGYYGLGALESAGRSRAAKKILKNLESEADQKTIKDLVKDLKGQQKVDEILALANGKNKLSEEQLGKLRKAATENGWTGNSKKWVNEKVIDKVFKGNKKAALAATLAAGGVLGAGIGYAAGHKK